MGMVRQESRCETSAIPDGTPGSFPEDVGMTTVLRPSGIASAQSAQMMKVRSSGKSLAMSKNSVGNIRSLIAVTTYMLLTDKHSDHHWIEEGDDALFLSVYRVRRPLQ